MNSFCSVCRFVWRKKIERDVTNGVPLDVYSVKSEKQRQRERMVHSSSPTLLLCCFFSSCCLFCFLVSNGFTGLI